MHELEHLSINGTWVNQNGSTVEFVEEKEAGKGALKGVYVSRKGRSASGKPYPLTGHRNGVVLAFQVSWQDAKDNLESITSFSGHLGLDVSGEPTIHTLWTLVRRWEDEARSKPTAHWNAFLTNVDVFARA